MLSRTYICRISTLVNICVGSYLDHPRIHFTGRYYADVNTVNNVPHNYKLTLAEDDIYPYWNPSGGNDWTLQDCRVTAVVYLNGTRNSKHNTDPLVGASVETNPYSANGKLASLDVDAWNKSALFGVTLGVKQSTSSSEFGFLGSLLPNSVIHQNAWHQVPCRHTKSTHKDVHGARSASILEKVQWASELDSEVLKQLKQLSTKHGRQLSISFAFYDFTRDSNAGNFSYGRISGTIGYARSSEPRFFGGERLLSFEFVDQPHLSWPADDACTHEKEWLPYWAYRAPFKVDSLKKILTVDYSSAFTRDLYGGIRDLGDLYLGILLPFDDGNFPCVEIVGYIDYLHDKCRELNGCIVDHPLTAGQLYLAETNPLIVARRLTTVLTPTATTYHQCGSSPPQYSAFHRAWINEVSYVAFMLEQGYYTRPYNYYTFVLEKSEVEVAVVDLLVTSLGRPAFGKTVEMLPTPYTVLPVDGVSYNREATVDKAGYARFVFRANSINMPRRGLDMDGQVYLYRYHVKGEPQFCDHDIREAERTWDGKVTCVELITIKVYSDISYDSPSNWVDHVYPVFLQYARLYPVMKNIVDLSDYEDVIQPYVRHLLNFSMQLDWNHPSYMPVSRDLSSVKRRMILEWLAKPCYNSTHCLFLTFGANSHHPLESSPGSIGQYIPSNLAHKECAIVGNFNHQPHNANGYFKYTAKYNANIQSINCIEELTRSMCSVSIIQYCLQKAFELEFYTIPLYLTTLYSIKDGYNTEAYSIIRGVVMQEMLHILQAANLLISVGGRPIIDSATTAPRYPVTGLPGGVLPHLSISLKRASLDQLHSTLMAIEYPHKVVNAQYGTDENFLHTIGQLYHELQNCLRFHGDSIFYPNRTSLQVRWPYSNDYGDVYIVHDLATGLRATEEIIEQGEGVQPGDPHGYARHELAHFFKFQEIVCGRGLVFYDVSNYTYTGDTLRFDDNGVWPMRDNPSSKGLDPSTRAYKESKMFHSTYRTLLRTLDQVFNGDPESISEALAIMESLKVQAKFLMALPVDASQPHGETCGLVFDYDWNSN